MSDEILREIVNMFGGPKKPAQRKPSRRKPGESLQDMVKRLQREAKHDLS